MHRSLVVEEMHQVVQASGELKYFLVEYFNLVELINDLSDLLRLQQQSYISLSGLVGAASCTGSRPGVLHVEMDQGSVVLSSLYNPGTKIWGS